MGMAHFGIARTALPGEESSQRRAPFGPIRIQALGRDEFRRGALKAFTIGGRLAGGRDGSEQGGSPDAHAAIGIR